MPITSASAQKILRLLNQKVREGTLDSGIAEHLSVLAMQEVAPAPAESAEAPAEEPVEKPAEEPAAPPAPPAVDPKSKILGLLTDFEKQANQLFQSLQAQVNAVLQGTEGAAFPVGNFDVKAKDNTSKLAIKAGDGKGSVDVSFSYDRFWTLQGVQPPVGVQAGVEETCHLPLRKDVLATASDVEEYAASELSWQRKRPPVSLFAHFNQEANRENDQRVQTILAAVPYDKSSEDWKRWALAAQVYLLGSDFSSQKSFADILKEVP